MKLVFGLVLRCLRRGPHSRYIRRGAFSRVILIPIHEKRRAPIRDTRNPDLSPKMSDAVTKKGPKVPKKPAEHPKYIDMIIEAAQALKERGGSSRQAILKHVVANNKVGENAQVHVKSALKRGVASGVLTQTKGTGASGSFKVAKPAVAPKKPATTTKAAKPKKKTETKAKKSDKKAKVTGKKSTKKGAAAKGKPASKKPSAKKSTTSKGKKPTAKPTKKSKKPTPKKKTPAKKSTKSPKGKSK